jgi:hypothetical protein
VKKPSSSVRVETKDLLWGAVGVDLYVGKRKVGKFIAEKRGNDRAVVRRAAMRSGYERRGLGTKGYEALARWACENGRDLASDSSLTDASRGFWEKQVRKGRAAWDADEQRYVLFACSGDLSGVRRR